MIVIVPCFDIANISIKRLKATIPKWDYRST
jgi:hypothetical protein